MSRSRPLGPVEEVLWKLDRAGSMNFTIVVELDSSIDPERLRSALRIEEAYHPRLGARIEHAEDSTPLMVFDPPMPIPLRIVDRRIDNTWCSELERELNQTIDWTRGPLARATLVLGNNASELLLTLHHAIGDATSGILLIRNILNLISKGDRAYPLIRSAEGKTTSIEKSMGLDMTNLGFRLRTLGFGVKQLMGSIIHRPQKLAHDAYALPADRYTRIIHKTVTSETTMLLRTAVKEFGTTIHGALCASMMIAAYADIRSRKHKKICEPMRLACMSPVDMRKYCPEPSEQDIGFYVSTTVADDHVKPETPFWSLASSIASRIHRKLELGEPLMSLYLQSRSFPSTLSPDKLASRIEKMIAAAVGVTNIGLINSDQFCSEFHARSIHFAAAVNAIAGTGFLCSAATFCDQLTLNFQYASPLIGDARAGQLASRVVNILVTVAQKNRLTVDELIAD